MGLGASVVPDQAPIELGTMAQSSPILSTASLLASNVMLKMASVPRSQRLAEMVRTLNAVQRGLGDSARADFARRVATAPANKVDQAMFDAIRAAIADHFVQQTLAQRPAGSGLGQTIAEAQGRTSQNINDANAIFCSYVAGTVGMIGGVLDQTGTGSGTGALTSSTQTAGQIAGCGAGQLVIRGQQALDQARLAQQGTVQALAMQQAADARFMRYVLVGGGAIAALGIGYAMLKKAA
jgi:hypothetical protein